MVKFREGPVRSSTPEQAEGMGERAETLPPTRMEEVLSTNPVETIAELQTGGLQNKVYFVTISDGKKLVGAIFKPKYGEVEGYREEGTGYKRERAAYLVDRVFGFDLVPPTVVRFIEGNVGSVQLHIPDHTTLADLFNRGDPCWRDERFTNQYKTMRVFDFIIGAEDRHWGNAIKDTNEKVWCIDNEESFLPQIRKRLEFDGDVPHETKQRLIAVVDSEQQKAVLRRILMPYLTRKEIEEFIRRIEWLADKFRSRETK